MFLADNERPNCRTGLTFGGASLPTSTIIERALSHLLPLVKSAPRSSDMTEASFVVVGVQPQLSSFFFSVQRLQNLAANFVADRETPIAFLFGLLLARRNSCSLKEFFFVLRIPSVEIVSRCVVRLARVRVAHYVCTSGSLQHQWGQNIILYSR